MTGKASKTRSSYFHPRQFTTDSDFKTNLILSITQLITPSMHSEKKPNKRVVDRSGKRYWDVKTKGCHEPFEKVGDKPDHPNCCKGHQRAHELSTEGLSDSDDDAPLKPIKQKNVPALPPNFAEIKASFTFPKSGSSHVPVYSESDDDAVSTTGLASTSQYGTSPQTFFEASKECKKKSPAAASGTTSSTQPDADSLWQAKTLGEERELSLKYWLTLTPKEKRAIVKLDKDMETFFKVSLPKKQKGSTKSLFCHNRSGACACPDCDTKRSCMQIQFEPFFARYKMAQSMNAAAAAAAASDYGDPKPLREESQQDLKSKALRIAQGFLEKEGKVFTEISNRLLAEQLRAISCCERHSSKGCSLDNSDVCSTDGSSSESYPENGHNTCDQGSACERETNPRFAGHALEELTAHSSFTTMAAHMMGFTATQQSSRRIEIHGKTIEFNSKTLDINHINLSSSDKAPFPAANPPAGVESSSLPCTDKECTFQCQVNQFDDGCSEISSPEDHFRLALERATDDDSLIKIYIAKLFDYRILNAYRDMLIQQRQLQLIEEFETEARMTKTKPKSKKDKKKTPKSNKQFEEALARKREEARLEEQARKLREARELELAAQRQKEEEEHAAQVQRARAINKQAREQAEKSKKLSKPENIRSPVALKPTKPVERPVPAKPIPQPKVSTPAKASAPRALPTKSTPLPILSSSPKAPPKPASAPTPPPPIITPKRVIAPPAAPPNPILEAEWPALNPSTSKNPKETVTKDQPQNGLPADLLQEPHSPPLLPWATDLAPSSGLEFAPYQLPLFNTGFPYKFNPLPSDGLPVDSSFRSYYLPKPAFSSASHLTPTPLERPHFTLHPPPGLSDLPFVSQSTAYTGNHWPLSSALPVLPFADDEQAFIPPPTSQLCNDPLISQVRENARHSYFSLLMDMGVGLGTHAKDRPYVPFSELYLKYTSLFTDRVVSLAQFYQFCSLQSSTNTFEFQPDSTSAYPSVRHFSSLSPAGDSSTSFLSTLHPLTFGHRGIPKDQ
ncbi:hypothetical protein DSO57_1017288 [Entomophthora muscae]|uniref:Uncharacterized protein n=1 Tax=Entomophthora muscae TaxID=34485 RepID=A0ACC2UQQ9_9FUNG|nr:hypothetical protein DSO57_1017288 [Entomophthora muscae]